jgi:DNA-binding transcriptional ArsR family regulator
MIAKEPLNLKSVAEHFPVSRPAISKHIRILTECGLITINKWGRDRYCNANLASLREASEWINQYRKFWNDKLDALEDLLNDDHRSNFSFCCSRK